MADADIQFERAEFEKAPSQPACAACATPLLGSYFQVNGAPVCERCSFAARELQTGGSGAGRLLRAAGAGVAAALGGAVLYWAILALTGYEFALIAIVVGFLVGKAVNWGSRGRGGWAYQALAVVLTYLSIVSAYVPLIISEFVDQPAEQTEVVDENGGPATPVSIETAAPAANEADAPSDEPMSAQSVVLAFAIVLAIAVAAPFLSGIQNIIGLVIIGIGLYQAWKMNRARTLVITGPHALAAPPPAAGSGVPA